MIANCPHCFNTPRNEYPTTEGASRSSTTRSCSRASSPRDGCAPAAGSRRRSRTTTRATSAATTTCTATPAGPWSSIPGVETVEMPRHGERALLRRRRRWMWMEERIGKRINQERSRRPPRPAPTRSPSRARTADHARRRRPGAHGRRPRRGPRPGARPLRRPYAAGLRRARRPRTALGPKFKAAPRTTETWSRTNGPASVERRMPIRREARAVAEPARAGVGTEDGGQSDGASWRAEKRLVLRRRGRRALADLERRGRPRSRARWRPPVEPDRAMLAYASTTGSRRS